MDVFEFINGLRNSDENLIRSTDELNKAICHIVQLLQDASTLYINGSYPNSAFLSITACEEVAKAHIGSFTDGQDPDKNSRNVFRDHKAKHRMAALPTVPMGSRLENAIGKVEIQKIINIAQNAGFVQIRERSLYFQRENDVLTTPKEKIDKTLARALLLFAIEVFDDALVGFTEFSFKMGEVTDELFDEIKNT